MAKSKGLPFPSVAEAQAAEDTKATLYMSFLASGMVVPSDEDSEVTVLAAEIPPTISSSLQN
jgi:hypothetical protein